MKLLGIDTTASLASVVVLNEENLYIDTDTNEITHSEKLLPLINRVLENSNLKFDDIDILATTNGPGSFTGCRIGVATIKALSHPKSLNILAISSLELIAFQAFLKLNKDDINICSILDAKNNRVYYCLYNIRKKNSKIYISKLNEISNEDLFIAMNELSKFNNLTFAGDCLNKFNENIQDYSRSNNLTFETLTEDIKPEAQYLAEYYIKVDNIQDKIYNTFNLDVVYARVSQAERYKNEHK